MHCEETKTNRFHFFRFAATLDVPKDTKCFIGNRSPFTSGLTNNKVQLVQFLIEHETIGE